MTFPYVMQGMGHTHHQHSPHVPPVVGAVTDPVCGMTVVPGTARGGSATHAGHEYWFCNPKCREKFVADPAKYLAPPVAQEPAASAAEAGTIYTCPMHPEVRQVGPGTCPKCGMALEPETPSSAEEGPNPELADMTRRFWIGAALTLPLLALAMGELVGFAPLSATARGWVELALATPVVLWGGLPFFQRGWSSIRHRSPNMFTLIAIGAGAAFAYSVLATLAPSIVPAAM